MGWVHYDNLNVPIRANIEVINSFFKQDDTIYAP